MTGADHTAVLDASVVVDLLAPDVPLEQSAGAALGRLAARGVAFVGPGLLVHEARNALLTGVRRRRWDGAAADEAARRLAQIPVTITDDERDAARAWELARRYDNHPIYDMVYLAMAERLGAVLLTQDERLRGRLAHLDLVRSPSEID